MPKSVRLRSVRRGPLFVALLLTLGLTIPAGALAAPRADPPRAAPGPTVELQILNISDWHGQLDPFNGLGGAAALATYFQADRAAADNTIILTAGDDVGATPSLSGFFDDVPAILAERLMGIQVGTFGNHNFDSGIERLQSQIDLAGSTDPSVPGSPFEYVVSNLENRDAELNGVADYKIFSFKGVKVAVIGAINEEAPTLVFPGRFGSMTPTDSVAAVMAAREDARREGANVFIAIAHKGVTSFDAAGNAHGPLIDFASALTGFHAVIGDHTDVQWFGQINGALVWENLSRGVQYTRAKLQIHRGTGALVGWSHEFVTPVAANVTPDPKVVEMLAPYRAQLAAIMDTKIGVATAVFPRGGNVERSGEVAIGNLIADAMRLRYGTDFGFTNGGGIRAPLPSAYVPQNPALNRTVAPFDLVMGDPYEILPFGNIVVVREITGAQLWAALENGVSQINPANGLGTDGRFPQISGFRFTFNSTLAPGSRVLTVTWPDGTPIPNDGTNYSVALPDFVNNGGDFYSMFVGGHGATRDLMADVLRDRIIELETLTPTLDGRIDDVAH